MTSPIFTVSGADECLSRFIHPKSRVFAARMGMDTAPALLLPWFHYISACICWETFRFQFIQSLFVVLGGISRISRSLASSPPLTFHHHPTAFPRRRSHRRPSRRRPLGELFNLLCHLGLLCPWMPPPPQPEKPLRKARHRGFTKPILQLLPPLASVASSSSHLSAVVFILSFCPLIFASSAPLLRLFPPFRFYCSGSSRVFQSPLVLCFRSSLNLLPSIP